MQRPTLRDVFRARRVISRYLSRTPLNYSPALSKLIGADIYIKHENVQPIGAFKVRGGINRLHALSEDERRRGVVTASTGNHGQSIAYAARTFGVRAVILAPEGNNPDKVASMQNLGAEVILYGKDFDEAREYAERMARDQGLVYIHPANDPLLIAGVGTMSLEILEDLPDTDVIITPVGGGSCASGSAIVAKGIDPAIRVIGVQSEHAPVAYRSWKEGRLLTADTPKTFAEGMATRVAFELPQSILRDLLDDFILVSDDELKRAILLLLETTHHLAEGAGAASTAAALRLKDHLQGQKVCLILSGANLTLDTLDSILKDRARLLSY